MVDLKKLKLHLSLPDMINESIYITALGASTPIGRDAWSSAAAVRAGISGFTQHPYMADTVGEPIIAAIAAWIDIGLQDIERFEALLFPAIDQALAPLAIHHTLQLRLALSLGLPSPRPGLSSDLQPSLKKSLEKRYSGIFEAVAIFPNGHAAGLLALEAAINKLEEGGLDACVVVGVDSYIEPETLEWLERSDQLHGAGLRNNAWGFIPGEAAGSILLMCKKSSESLSLHPLARVLSLGIGFELNCIKTESVCIGEGLTQAFRAALSALPEQVNISNIYCDMNGEYYRADEYSFASLRTKQHFASPSNFIAPADCWGDVSAASGLLNIGLAVIAASKDYAEGNYAFVWASSESGERAAVVLETQKLGV